MKAPYTLMVLLVSSGTQSVFVVCVAVFALAVQCQVSWGQTEINLVSPSQMAEEEGNFLVQRPGPAVRIQMLYPAADFMSLPESHHMITGVAWRPDESNRLTRPISGPLRISLSTTSTDRLHPTFANNIGDDEKLVFDGSLTWQTDTLGPGPRDFDFSVDFDEAFTYDPSQGRDLLLEFVASEDWDNVGNWRIDEHLTNTGGYTFLAAVGSPRARVATITVRGGYWPAQFTFAPTPSPLTGDFDEDGVLTAVDIDALTAAIIDQSAEARFDLNADGSVDLADQTHWVKELKNTWFGDANLDGEFSSEDLVTALQAGKYELDMDTGWAEGDWTGDRRFDTSDLVTAFGDGGYELGTRAAVGAVPEPASAIPLGIAMIGLCRLRKRR